MGRVLVVDDSAIVRKLIVRELVNLQFAQGDIVEGTDGIEAVANAIKHQFDLILMDWNMPNMSGLDAIKAIRSAGVATPIIMVTTESERSRVIAAIQAGANNYLVKPFTSDDFRSKVAQFLGIAVPAAAATAAPSSPASPPAAAPPPPATATPATAPPPSTDADEDAALRAKLEQQNLFNRPFEKLSELEKICARAYFGDAKSRFRMINLMNKPDELARLGREPDTTFLVLEMFFHDSILNGIKQNSTELEAFKTNLQVGVSVPKYAAVEVEGKTRFFDEFLSKDDLKNNLFRSCLMARLEGKPTRQAFDQRIKSVLDSGVDSVLKLYGLKPALELQQEFETKGIIT